MTQSIVFFVDFGDEYGRMTGGACIVQYGVFDDTGFVTAEAGIGGVGGYSVAASEGCGYCAAHFSFSLLLSCSMVSVGGF
jgi:hypothetical protein